MNLQKFMELAEVGMQIEFDDLIIQWIGQKNGPYNGKDGKVFYTKSFLLDDGTYTSTYEKNGETRDSHGVFASFSYRDWMDDLQVNDHVACKLKYDTYQARDGTTRVSIKGSHLHRAEGVMNQGPAPTTAPPNMTDMDEFKNLITQVIDPLFNAMWNQLTAQQQQKMMGQHKAQIGALNRYLPE